MQSPGPRPSEREREEVRMGYRMMGIGFEVVSQVGAGLLLGWLWDRWRARLGGADDGRFSGQGRVGQSDQGRGEDGRGNTTLHAGFRLPWAFARPC